MASNGLSERFSPVSETAAENSRGWFSDGFQSYVARPLFSARK